MGNKITNFFLLMNISLQLFTYCKKIELEVVDSC